jgi:hypothetical protein
LFFGCGCNEVLNRGKMGSAEPEALSTLRSMEDFAWDIGALMGQKIFDSTFPEVAATKLSTQWLFMVCYEGASCVLVRRSRWWTRGWICSPHLRRGSHYRTSQQR